MNLKIKISNLIVVCSLAVLFLFATHDSIVRLWPVLPYTIFEYFFLGILIFLTVYSKCRINKRSILLFITVYFVVFLNLMIGENQQREYVESLFLNLGQASKLWAFFIVFSLIKDEKKWFQYLIWIAYICMFFVIVTTLNGLYSGTNREVNYLGIGITGALWIPIIMQRAFISEGKIRVIHTISTVIMILFSAIYGNRGSVVAVVTFLIYCILHYTKLRKKVQMSILIGIVVIVAYTQQDIIQSSLSSVVSHFGVNSRNLTLLLSGQISYTTHRADEIWVTIKDAILDKPFIGYGLCYDRVLGGDISIYAHNLILEVWVSFGVIIGSALIAAHLWIGCRMCFDNKNVNWSNLFSPFFISMTTLLMFNNSFCQLGYFWISYGVYFAFLKWRKRT